MGCIWARQCVGVFLQIPRNMYVNLGKDSNEGSGDLVEPDYTEV